MFEFFAFLPKGREGKGYLGIRTIKHFSLKIQKLLLRLLRIKENKCQTNIYNNQEVWVPSHATFFLSYWVVGLEVS